MNFISAWSPPGNYGISSTVSPQTEIADKKKIVANRQK